MTRNYNSLRLTVQTTQQPVDSCLTLDNPSEYGFSFGVIAKIDSKFLLMLWDINNRKVLEESYLEIVEAQVGFITGFGPTGMLSLSVPDWTFTDPTDAFIMAKLKEPVSKE